MPVFSVDKEKIIFTDTIISQEDIQTINIENLTASPITVSLSIFNPFYLFFNPIKKNSSTITIQGNSNKSIVLLFKPIKQGEYSTELLINSETETIEIKVFGKGIIKNDYLYEKVETNVKERYIPYVNPETVEQSNDYIDLDLKFQLNPITNDIAKKLNENAIMQSIKNIILAKKLWTAGGIDYNLKNIIFEPDENFPFLEENIFTSLEELIIKNEPRIGEISVSGEIDMFNMKTLNLNIKFSIKGKSNIFYEYPIFIKLR